MQGLRPQGMQARQRGHVYAWELFWSQVVRQGVQKMCVQGSCLGMCVVESKGDVQIGQVEEAGEEGIDAVSRRREARVKK